MSELVGFLEKNISYDEQDARAALDDVPGVGLRWVPTTNRPSHMHIARHDPAHVLAECAAKRRIIERWRRGMAMLDDGSLDIEEQVGHRLINAGLFEALRILSGAYADRPGYQPEWAL